MYSLHSSSCSVGSRLGLGLGENLRNQHKHSLPSGSLPSGSLHGHHRPRRGVSTDAKARQRKGGMGFVEEDNSGKANIFAVEPKTLWTASPRADKEARRGLGGTQGLAVVLGVAGAVAVATVGVSFFQGDSLEEVGRGYGGGETLQEIAARM